MARAFLPIICLLLAVPAAIGCAADVAAGGEPGTAALRLGAEADPLPHRAWLPSEADTGGRRRNAAHAGKVAVEPSTPRSLALRWPIAGDDNGNARVMVAYRAAGESAWRRGFPLFWIHPDGARSAAQWRRDIAAEKGRPVPGREGGPYPPVPEGRLFAGSIVDLAPDTAYDVRLDLADPDGGSEQRLLRMRTSVEPALPAGMRVRHVVPAPETGGGAGSGTRDDPFQGLAAAAGTAQPGDLFRLGPGTYRVGTLKPPRSGEPGRPIVFRGGNGEAILDGGGAPTLIDAAGLRHVWFEGLTLRNADVLIQARMASHIVVRGNRFLVARKKLAAGFEARDADYDESRGFFITDNDFVGPTAWPRKQIAKGVDEFVFAVAITGSGHVVAFNRIRNVGDGINNGGGGFLSASDIHNNDIDGATDDCIEADHSATNLRVFRNRLTNCFAGVSLQPVHGGPAYVFRNRILNTQYSPFKLHNHPSGVLIFHNTSVRSGIPFPILQKHEAVNDVVTRNNVFIGSDGPAISSTGRMVRCDFDNDGYGWNRGGFALWNQRRYPSPLATRDGDGPYARLGAVMLHTGGTFAGGLAAQDYRTRRTPDANDPRLAPGSRAVDRGVALPNFNNVFAGAAPDLGCCEAGAPLPRVGPRPGTGPGTKPPSAYRRNPALTDLPRGRWVKIHQQRPGDAVRFVRQKHSGSAFDTRRGRIVLFGSDTHAKDDWTNSPLFFDLGGMEWQRLYADDDPATYAVTPEGLPVAGPRGDHPWAMHTFGAVTYDPETDSVVVASYPRHMAPGRFNTALADLWPKVRRHPTWVLHLDTGRWEPLAAKPVHFFPYATAFDPGRGVVMGYRGDGIYELSPASGLWRKVGAGGLLGWGNNAAFDSRNRALVVFGSHQGRNDVVVYEPATGRHRMMPTPGPRPPGGTYVPMAYHPGAGRVVAVVDRAPEAGIRDRRRMRAETWLYDVAGDSWTRVAAADLPFGVGMNYNLEYDPGHRLLLLVADPPGEAVAVWALRL